HRPRAGRVPAAPAIGGGGTAMMRRVGATRHPGAGRGRRALLLALLLLVALPGVASAHPLGNFSINHLTEVSVSTDRVDVRYILDQAEIPTFQERGLSDAEVIARKQAEVQRRLALTVDGRRIALRPGDATISHPPGAGGLPTTRL